MCGVMRLVCLLSVVLFVLVTGFPVSRVPLFIVQFGCGCLLVWGLRLPSNCLRVIAFGLGVVECLFRVIYFPNVAVVGDVLGSSFPC